MADAYMVRCDIEGATGVVSYEQAEPGKAEYEFGRRMFMSDLVALVEGLHAGGADEVWVYDEHYYGRNIDLAQLDACARVICGKPPYTKDWAGGLNGDFLGLALLGFHSKADTPGGLLPHTYELDIKDLRLNNVSVGEIGMEAAIAGDFGVPTQLVIADSAGVAEAQALLPGVETVVVKESLGASGALCYPTEATAKHIRRVAAEVMQNPPRVAPFTVGGKVDLSVALREGPYLDSCRKLFASSLSGGDTLIIKGDSASDVWSQYWGMKLQAKAQI
jgi:D-amino peptidase